MDPQQFLLYAGTFTATWKYLLLFVGVVVEGPILMVASGFFLRLGVFELAPLFVVIILADLVGDIGWYYIGHRFAAPLFARRGGFMGISYDRFEKIKGLFDKYHERILFISKITLGFGLALGTLIVAGATRVPFKKYMIVNFSGEVVLVAVMLCIGYVFGELYNDIHKDFKILSVVGASIVVGFLLYEFVRFMRNKIRA